MNVSELILQNNQKRKLLTQENEKYYSKIMLYIRTKLTLSEQQSEEVLMEMLDHLIEGQEEGKSARSIFGNDPKSFADEIISQLPNEEKRNTLKFVSQLGLNLLGWFLVIRSIIIIVLSQFQEVDTREFIIPSLIILLLIGGTVALGVKLIFNLIHKSLFNENASDKKNMLKAGLFGGGSFALILLASFLINDFGPAFEFPWMASLGIGSFLLLVTWLMKKNVI